MKNQLNITIKCLRADDENEFIDKNFQEFLINNKIRWKLRTSYVLKQNEKLKQMNYIFITSIQFMFVVKNYLNSYKKRWLKQLFISRIEVSK